MSLRSASSPTRKGHLRTPSRASRPEHLHLGILAPEYPPHVGGMAELARGLTEALAAITEVTLFTREGPPESSGQLRRQSVLTLDVSSDASILEQSEPDALLTLNAGLIPIARRLNRPFFAYVHGNDFLQPWIPCGPRWFEKMEKPYAGVVRHWLRRSAVKRSASSLRHLFCNSQRTAQLVEAQLGLARDQVSVVPPGVHEDFFAVKRPAPSPQLRLLTVSNLSQYVPRKNIDGVLHAIKLLKDRHEITYTVAGGGDDLERLRRLAKELDLSSSVDFRGRVGEEELLNCYANADLFVLASKASPRDVEGFGIVYLEASAAGIPVICSREGGATDAVEEGVNGLLISDSSPASIASGIDAFASNRERFSSVAIREFAAQFRWEELAPQLLQQVFSSL